MNRPLTKQQQLVYDFIRGQIVSRGYGPTVREIGEHKNIKSPNGVMCHLLALERKGMLTRTANKSRAIELTEPISRVASASLPVSASVLGGSCLPMTGSEEQPFDFACLAPEDGWLVRVLDDSLADAHMVTGDMLVVQPRETIENGQLAIVRSGGATFVRFWYAESGRLRLESVNRNTAPILVDSAELVGVVTGVVRRFALTR